MKNINNFNLVLIIGIFMIIACACPSNEDKSDSAPKNETNTAINTQTTTEKKTTEKPKTTEETKAVVNLENFNKIKTGMKYDEVVNILGKEGEVLSENEIGKTKTVMYKWDGEATFSNMNAMFQNGKLISKSQFGLK